MGPKILNYFNILINIIMYFNENKKDCPFETASIIAVSGAG
jgi:hypothetical protein